jgi:diacylglycerol O-acyltransferase / wax synthase
MQPLTTLDAAFVHLESEATPMHVGALFVLAPPAPARSSFVARLRRHVRARLGACPVFTRRLAPLPLNLANPFWDEAGDVDLAWHVRVTRVPRPGRRRELEHCVAALHEVRLDRERPLWQLHVLEGLADGRVGLYLKVHHAGLDGATAQVFLRCFTDDAPPSARVRPRAAASAERQPWDVLLAGWQHQAAQLACLPGTVRSLLDAAASARAVARAAAPREPLARDAVIAPTRGATRSAASATPVGFHRAPPTPLNVPISAARAFASADVPLAGVRALAKARGVTINDVILTACGGAVRRWLDDRDALPAATLLAAVPVSLRAPGDANLAVRVSFATVPLHTDLPTPAARLAAIAADTRRSKGSGHGALPVPGDLPSIGVPWLVGGVAWLAAQPAVAARVPLPWNVLVSNVVGPPVPLHVLGTRVLTYTPVSIPYHGLALNVTVYSYAGRLYFGLTAAREVVPDVAALARSVLDELRGLQRAPAPRPARRRAR